MATKFKVQTSHYISPRGFAIVVNANYDFLSRMPCPVILHLEDGTQSKGQLTGGRFWLKERGKRIWGLMVKSDEIQKPEVATIACIEIS